MENRRQDYRYRFPALERPQVHLRNVEETREVNGHVVDLGLGGMCVGLHSAVSPFALDDHVVACLDLPGTEPLTLTGSVCYLERRGAELTCGLQFFRLRVPAADTEEERPLAKFLAKAQRRHRKQQSRHGRQLKLFTGE